MLKTTIVVILMLIRSSTATKGVEWSSVPVAENTAQCVYQYIEERLSCRAGNGNGVECQAVYERAWTIAGDGKGPNKTFAFGLRIDPCIQSSNPIEKRLYELYPRKLNNTIYGQSTQKFKNEMVTLYLYTAKSVTQKGLRVTDSDCFVRLVDEVLNKATAKHVSKVNDFGHIEMHGEILMLGHQQKIGSGSSNSNAENWLWGYGWGGLGWGWGLGWGLPFW